jgi:flagellar motor switch protein FliM
VEHVTPEELTALADALRASASDATSAATAPQTHNDVVLRFDILGAAQSTSSQLPVLDLAHEQFAATLGTMLQRSTRQEVAAFGHPIETVKLGDVFAGLPEVFGVVVCELTGLSTSAALLVEPAVLVHTMDLLAGGPGGATAGALELIAERGLTGAEKRLANRLTMLASDALKRAWREVAPVALRPVRTESDPRYALFAESRETVYRFPIQLDWGDLSGQLVLLVPTAAFRPLEKRLSRKVVETALTREAEWQTELLREVQSVRVQVSAELGTTVLTLRQLLRLDVGDVVRLDRDQDGDVRLCVEGVEKYTAKPTVARGNLALVLSSDPMRPTETAHSEKMK